MKKIAEVLNSVPFEKGVTIHIRFISTDSYFINFYNVQSITIREKEILFSNSHEIIGGISPNSSVCGYSLHYGCDATMRQIDIDIDTK